MRASAELLVENDRLRRQYQPEVVRVLFVGESPPASGRFFYRANSGLYTAVRDAFAAAFPSLRRRPDFLLQFRNLGCYLVDLCPEPVDHLPRALRNQVCSESEARLAEALRSTQPPLVVTVVRSIAANVDRALTQAQMRTQHAVLPYPGRWQKHRLVFIQELVPILQTQLPFASGSAR